MAVTAGAAQLLVLVPMIGIVADDAGQSAATAGGGQPANGGNDLQLVEVGVCVRALGVKFVRAQIARLGEKLSFSICGRVRSSMLTNAFHMLSSEQL